MFPEYPPEWDDDPVEQDEDEREEWDETEEACSTWEIWRDDIGE